MNINNTILHNLFFDRFDESINKEDAYEEIAENIETKLSYEDFKIPKIDEYPDLFDEELLKTIDIKFYNEKYVMVIEKILKNKLEFFEEKDFKFDDFKLKFIEMNRKFSNILEVEYDENYLFSKIIIFIYFTSYYQDYENESSDSSDKDLKIFFEDFIEKYRIYFEEPNIENLKNVLVLYFLLSPIVMNKFLEDKIELSDSFKELNNSLRYTTKILENSINIRKNIDKIKELNNNIKNFNDGFNETLKDVKSSDIIILMKGEYDSKILKFNEEIKELFNEIDILQNESNIIQNNNILVN